MPDGYSLEKEIVTPICVQYKFEDKKQHYIWFEQKAIDGTDFYIDNESGYSKMNNVQDYEVYYRNTNGKYIYIWNDGKYSIKLSSNKEITNDDIILIIEGLIIK